MAWNEPGGGQRDPWKKSDRSTPSKPDLQKWLKPLGQRFGKLFNGPGGLLTLILALVLVWMLLSSYVIVGTAQVGVVLRLGAYARTLSPGVHLKWPTPLEAVTLIDNSRARSVSDTLPLLTKEGDIVSVGFTVQYQVTDARKYLYATRDADSRLRAAAETVVRGAVGSSSLDELMNDAGAAASGARQSLQALLHGEDNGVAVTDLSLQNVSPPAEIKDAFDDVDNARQDQQARVAAAKADADKQIPLAHADAAQLIGDAQAYKISRIGRAQAETTRFNLILAQYKSAPDLTRRRMQFEMLEEVLAANTKVVDETGHAIVNLPAPGADTSAAGGTTPAASGSAQPASVSPSPDTDGKEKQP